MHIFLTGPLQSGKSTAIARYLVGRPEAPGGFRTHWDRAGGRLMLELLETGETLSVATMEPHGVRADRAAFDAAGEHLLSAPAGRRSLLLMDELGFLERCSPVFQRAVFTLLDGPTPVLGAAPPRKKSLLGPCFPPGGCPAAPADGGEPGGNSCRADPSAGLR